MKHFFQFSLGVVVWVLLSILSTTNVSAQNFPVEQITNNGSRVNRINLVYLPDGYTAAQMPTFSDHARTMNTALFATSPFKEYSRFFNVFTVQAPSAQSGVTHPRSAPDCPPRIPTASPTTYFETTFDYANIHRLVATRRSDKITMALAASVPDYDQAFIVANSTEYGGSGGANPVATGGNSNSFNLIVHELGHSFAFLADEYWAGQQYAVEKPNMTMNANTSTNKWSYWVGRAKVGIFPHTGNASWYRPSNNGECKMEALESPFCAVCAEALVLKIHALVSPIDAVHPAVTSPLEAPVSGVMPFALTLVKPEPNTLRVRWLLNGMAWGASNADLNADSILLPVSALRIGMNTFTAEVTDETPMIRPQLHPKRSVVWNVMRSNPSGVLTEDHVGTLSIFPNPTDAGFVLQYELPCASAEAVVEIVDMAGKHLWSKPTGSQAAGHHRVMLDVSETQLSEGAYLVSITTDCGRQTGKLLVQPKR